MTIENITPVVFWGIGIILGVPLATILLGEIIERLKARNSKYTYSFELARNVLIPAIVAFIVVQQILSIDSENSGYRIVTSLLLIAAAYVGFILFNAIGSERDASRWENRVPGLFKTILRFFVILYPIYMLTGVWGIDLSSFVTALGVGSLVIALALQDTLSSIVSGFLLVVDKPFSVGDWVKVDGYQGQVVDISWRSTRLQVRGNDVVVIPNLNLVGSSIYNYTMMDVSYRDSIILGFSYDDPPNKVKQVLLDMALDCPHVSRDPKPEVHTVSYDDSSIGYKLYYYVPEFKSGMNEERIKEDLMTRVFYTAERNDLSIPYPIQIEGRPQDFEPDQQMINDRIFEFLKWNRYFALLPDEVLLRLVSEVTVTPFAATETVMKQGVLSDSFYLIRSGEVGVLHPNDRFLNGSGVFNTLTAGDVLGILLLMGRRTNQITAVAQSDTVLYRIPGKTIQAIIEQHTGFARELNVLIERRIETLKERGG